MRKKFRELWIPETDFKDFFPALGHNYTKGLFSTRNIVPMMTGALGASLIVPWDEEGSEKISPYLEEVEEVGTGPGRTRDYGCCGRIPDRSAFHGKQEIPRLFL